RETRPPPVAPLSVLVHCRCRTSSSSPWSFSLTPERACGQASGEEVLIQQVEQRHRVCFVHEELVTVDQLVLGQSEVPDVPADILDSHVREVSTFVDRAQTTPQPAARACLFREHLAAVTGKG